MLDKSIQELSPQDMIYLTNHPKILSAYVARKDVKKYRYLCTFTLKPSLPAKDILDEVESYIVKQFRRKPLQIVSAHIVKEGDGDKLHHHWHVAVETKVPLKKDRFNYYQQKYGFVDIDKTKAQNLEETLNYISKSNTPTEIPRE